MGVFLYPHRVGVRLLLRLGLVWAAAVSCSSAAGAADGGAVKVFYAGSLAHVMQNAIRPAFKQNTNAQLQGFPGGSSKLANEIKGKVRRGDVFVSAHPEVNARLTGRANGGWVDWYATFMRSPLVIGYNPKSRFADALKSKPWYQVITESGFRLGRTDPKLDPKGKLAARAIRRIAKRQNRPALKQKILANARVFPEEGLVGRLQAGQLDAGFFYQGEAAAAGIPSVAIKPIELGAVYTVTVLNRAPNRAGAFAFIKFLLGAKGRSILKKNGFNLISPVRISGDESAVPAALRRALAAG